MDQRFKVLLKIFRALLRVIILLCRMSFHHQWAHRWIPDPMTRFDSRLNVRDFQGCQKTGRYGTKASSVTFPSGSSTTYLIRHSLTIFHWLLHNEGIISWYTLLLKSQCKDRLWLLMFDKSQLIMGSRHTAYYTLHDGYVFAGSTTSTILLNELSNFRFLPNETPTVLCLRLEELFQELKLLPGDAAVTFNDTQQIGIWLMRYAMNQGGIRYVQQLPQHRFRGT